MARRSLGERNIRNLQKNKSTYYVTLPISEVRSLKWRDRQKVVVERRGDTLIIKDWKE